MRTEALLMLGRLLGDVRPGASDPAVSRGTNSLVQRYKAALVLTLTLCASPAAGQTTTRVSVSSAGVQGNNWSVHPSISSDGRYVAFHSIASNLVPGDTHNTLDTFVHDKQTGETSRVGAIATGTAGNINESPSISSDGRFVAFRSIVSNLVPGDTNDTWDTFLHDRQTGGTSRISVSSAGVQGNSGSGSASISADGRFVAFNSLASNLVPGDTNDTWDTFVHDRQTGETSRVSVSSAGVQGNSGSGDYVSPSISADGRYVAMYSSASNLVPVDTNLEEDIFVHDRQTGETSRVSVSSSGVQGNSGSGYPSISADGRYVAFHSGSNNLVAGDPGSNPDIFVHDRQTGETSRVSVSSAGAPANGVSSFASISADGRYVAFWSSASNLVSGDTNSRGDIFVHDRQSGETRRVSVASTGEQGNQGGYWPSISADGRYVAFQSDSSNLVPGDTNGTADIFVHGSAPPIAFCFGDGSGTACTCSNNSVSGEGCANDTGNGAILTASGTSNVATDDLVLHGSQLVPSQLGHYYQGDNRIGGGNGVVFGDGLRCTGGNVIRLQMRFASNGGTSFTSVNIAALTGVSAGDTKYYQLWYRDPAGPCGSGFNLSNGLEVTWTP